MESTVNRFLTFAKPQEPLLTCLDVSALIEDVLLIVEPRAHHREIRVERQIALGLPLLKGDRRQLVEVLLNLMINSLEAMSKGGVLSISALEENTGGKGREPGRRVKIIIADTGTRIDPDVVEKIFDPFFTTKPSGTGLGLSIAHQTVTRHGGHMEIETCKGKGTTFTVLLPAALEEACG